MLVIKIALFGFSMLSIGWCFGVTSYEAFQPETLLHGLIKERKDEIKTSNNNWG